MSGKRQSVATVASVVLVGMAVAILAVGFVPLSTPRITINQIRAVHATRKLLAAERQYANEFPAIGFTCDLHKLSDAGLIDVTLASGQKNAYLYELEGRHGSARSGAFTVTAVPSIAGVTGRFTFCVNEEGVLWYAENGSLEDCLRRRITWKKSDPLQ